MSERTVTGHTMSGHTIREATPAAHEHHGHGDHAEEFRRRFWWSLVLTVPLVITSHMGVPLGWLAVPCRGRAGARSRQPGMMLLIAMAITVASRRDGDVARLVRTRILVGARRVISIMLLGHWQEMKALGQARDALSALAELLPDGWRWWATA